MSWASLASYYSASPRDATPRETRSSRLMTWIPVVLAAVLRLLFLGMKPPHFDEGVNGWFVDQITKTGFYHYDPSNYHGPLHFYVLFLFQTLLGRHIWALRLPIVFVSIATVYLVTRFDEYLDRRICFFAALAMAISPGEVFYTRYAIHEAWLVFFLILALIGLAGLWKSGGVSSLWRLGIGLTGMVLTKETYIIHVGCFLLAALSLVWLEPISPSLSPPLAQQRWSGRDLLIVFLSSCGVILFFYSGCFLDFSSLKGLLKTYGEWFKTGKDGHGHEKAWSYWLTLFWIYEIPALLGVAWSLRYALPKSDRLLRFIAVYGCGALAAYSIVRYKTPWCVASLLWPFFFLCGGLVDDLGVLLHSGTSPGRKFVAPGVAAALVLISAWISIRLNFFHYVDPREKYVYVQTLNDLYKLTVPLDKLVSKEPTAYQMKGNILLSSYHPLPWVLGDFPNIGYFTEKMNPEKFDADFLIVENARVDEVEKALKENYFTVDFQLRDGQDPSKLYFSYERFESVFPDREPDFEPDLGEPADLAPVSSPASAKHNAARGGASPGGAKRAAKP